MSSGDTNRNSTKLAGRATAKGGWGQIFVDDAGLRCCASVVAKPLRVECAGAISQPVKEVLSCCGPQGGASSPAA